MAYVPRSYKGFFSDDIHKNLDFTLTDDRFYPIYRYVIDVCTSKTYETYIFNPQEITFFVISTLQVINTIRHSTKLHSIHFTYLEKKIRGDVCTFFETYGNRAYENAIDDYTLVIQWIIYDMMVKAGELDSSIDSNIQDLIDNARALEIDTSVPANDKLLEKIKYFSWDIESSFEYNVLLGSIAFMNTKRYLMSTDYIGICAIVDSIRPANLQHIDIIKSFLLDVVDEADIDDGAKFTVRRNIKEKVDKIKISSLQQPVSSEPQQPTNKEETKIEEFLQLFTLPYQKRKEDCRKLIELLTQDGWAKKDRARFALAMYQSGNVALMRENINTFVDWWRVCCDMLGWEGADSPYKISQLTPNKATKQISLYL